jgi:hypothetical protein
VVVEADARELVAMPSIVQGGHADAEPVGHLARDEERTDLPQGARPVTTVRVPPPSSRRPPLVRDLPTCGGDRARDRGGEGRACTCDDHALIM